MLPEKPRPAAPADVLTPAQLACVRLILSKGSNKRIAQELGISPNTVSQHLKEARLRLGNVSRFEAAEIVAAWDTAYPHESTSAPRTVAPPVETAMVDPSPPSAETPSPVRVVREDISSFRPMDVPRALGLARLTAVWLRSLGEELTGPNPVRGALWLALILSLITVVLIGVGNTIQQSVITYHSTR